MSLDLQLVVSSFSTLPFCAFSHRDSAEITGNERTVRWGTACNDDHRATWAGKVVVHGLLIKPWILNISDHFLSLNPCDRPRPLIWSRFHSSCISLTICGVLFDGISDCGELLLLSLTSPRRAVVSQKPLFPSICCGITVCFRCSCDHRQAGWYQAYKKQLGWVLIVPVCVFQFHTMWSWFDSRALYSLTCTELSTHDSFLWII